MEEKKLSRIQTKLLKSMQKCDKMDFVKNLTHPMPNYEDKTTTVQL